MKLEKHIKRLLKSSVIPCVGNRNNLLTFLYFFSNLVLVHTDIPTHLTYHEILHIHF